MPESRILKGAPYNELQINSGEYTTRGISPKNPSAGRSYLYSGRQDLKLEVEVSSEAKQRFEPFCVGEVAIRTLEDGQPLTASVLVPQDIASGKASNINCPVYVRFHGGGFGRAYALFEPSFSTFNCHLTMKNDAILIMPNYRKLPEAAGADILADIDSFWTQWFNDEALFSSDMKSMFPQMNVKIRREQLLLSGDSSGGFLAVYSWLKHPNLKIKAMCLQYPMLRAFRRHKIEGDYYGVTINDDFVKRKAETLLKECDDAKLTAKERNEPFSRIKSVPLEGGYATLVLSGDLRKVNWNGKAIQMSWWKYRFAQPDIIEHLQSLLGPNEMETNPLYLPLKESTSGLPVFTMGETITARPDACLPIIITHGTADTSCHIDDSTLFVDYLGKLYNDLKIEMYEDFAEASKDVMAGSEEFALTGNVCLVKVTNGKHPLDEDINKNSNTWLNRVAAWIEYR